MNWSINGLWLGAALLLSAGGFWVMGWWWRRRFSRLQRELGRLSDDFLQMIELQQEMLQRICRNLNDLDEKVMALSVPSSDGPLPLERRHQVMTLSRKGMSVDEISRRLNMPKGEAELILSLCKYAEARPPAGKASAPVKEYARASS